MRKVLILAALFAAFFSPLRADNLMRGAHGPSYTAFNPADNTGVLSNSNLTLGLGAACGGDQGARAVRSETSGKWYWEARVTTAAGADTAVGWSIAGQAFGPIGLNGANAVVMFRTGNIYVNTVDVLPGAVPYASGDTIGVAFDRGGSLIWFTKDGTHWNSTSSGVNNPATGVGGVSAAGVANLNYPMAVLTCGGSEGPWTANFGATATAFTPPVGFSLLPGP